MWKGIYYILSFQIFMFLKDKSPQNAYIQKSKDVWFDIIQMFYISRGHYVENLYFHACFTAWTLLK
jgi:hypothetical protein